MLAAGGLMFCLGGTLNDRFSWKMDLLLQCLTIALMTTLLEAVLGNIDYYFLGQNIWDYNNMPLHYLNGKICIPFSVLWFLIGFPVIFIYDAITYYWMHEGEQPEYWIFGNMVWRMPERKCGK